MDMWLIILLAVGVVVSNLMILKHSAKYKFPTLSKEDETKKKSEKDLQEERSEAFQEEKENTNQQD